MEMPMAVNAKKNRGYIVTALLLALVIAGGGFVYWYQSGRVSFEGVTSQSEHVVDAGEGGKVGVVAVKPGQRVKRGEPLLYFDAGDGRLALEREEKKLGELTRMLPPEYIWLPDPDDPLAGDESLSQRLERRRGEEASALKLLQGASDKEAQASVLYGRAAILAAQGKLAPERKDLAERGLRAAEEENSEAKKRFEQLSLRRSATEMEIRRLREAQAASGADKIPLQQRLQAYEQQREKVERMASYAEAAVIAAPFDGIVRQVLAQSGQQLPPTSPAIILNPQGTLQAALASVPGDVAGKLKQGQQCLVSMQGHGEKPVHGYIRSIGPVAGDAEAFRVEVLLVPENGVPGADAFPPGIRADITALLREPLYLPENDSPGAAAAMPLPSPENPSEAVRRFAPAYPENYEATRGAVDAPRGEAAPPANPLSVESPLGNEVIEGFPDEGPARPAQSPLNLKAGSPEALGKASPPADDAASREAGTRHEEETFSLPPMKAPYPLRGKPLPDPANNPSIVRPQDLEPAYTRP